MVKYTEKLLGGPELWLRLPIQYSAQTVPLPAAADHISLFMPELSFVRPL